MPAKTTQHQRSANAPTGYFDLPRTEPHINTAIDEYLHLKDIADRRLWFNVSIASMDEVDVVDSTTLLATDIVHHIIQYNRDDTIADIPVDKRKPIHLYINSPGGNTYEGFAVVDAILTSKTPVYTYNVGMCASMGFMVFIAGHRRFTFPRAFFLHHEGKTGDWNTTGKFLDMADFTKRYEKEIVKDYVLRQTKISEKSFDEHMHVEWYILAKEAIELGIADKIVSSIDDILLPQP